MELETQAGSPWADENDDFDAVFNASNIHRAMNTTAPVIA